MKVTSTNQYKQVLNFKIKDPNFSTLINSKPWMKGTSTNQYKQVPNFKIKDPVISKKVVSR